MLDILKAEVARRQPGWVLKIDRADQSLGFTRPDGMVGRINPDNILARLRSLDSGAARRAELDHFLKAIDAAGKDRFDRAVASDVLPVLRPDSLMDYVAKRLGATPGSGKAPVVTRMPGPLDVYYVIDRPDSAAFLSHDDLRKMGITAAHLPEIARGNLHLRSAGKVTLRGGPPVYQLVYDGYYENSLLLLKMPAFFGTRLRRPIAVPLSRDVVLVADDAVPGARAKLLEMAKRNFATVTYPLSTGVWGWQPDGFWRPEGH